MSGLIELASLIRSTHAELAHTEQAAARGASSFMLELSTASLRLRLEDLEQQFAAATAAQEVDVCSYRLIPNHAQHYPVAALGRIFTKFQDLLSILYESIKRDKPRKRWSVSPESKAETSMNFGYAFAGSLGFVFTLPNERMLVGDSILDMAMTALVELPHVQTADAISQYAKKYGVAPVHLAYEWARAHIDADLSLDVEWKRGDAARAQLIIQVPELERFVNLVASTSDISQEEFLFYGELVGIDVKGRTFHLVVDGKDDIRGTLHESYRAAETIAIPSHYTAKLQARIITHYATGEEDKTYFLLSLAKGLVITPELGQFNITSEPPTTES